jgi:hypothetical protein
VTSTGRPPTRAAQARRGAGRIWSAVKKAWRWYLGDEPTTPQPQAKPKTSPAAGAGPQPAPASGQQPPTRPAPAPTRPPVPVPTAPQRPVQPAPPAGPPSATGGTMTRNPMLIMLESADEMVAIATRWDPAGMLPVLDAHKLLPDVLRRVADAVKILHRHAQERYPLNPVVVELIEAVHRHQMLTAAAAEEIAPTARALHRREIEALADPRNAMWDVGANQQAAPPPGPVPNSNGRSENSNV